MLQIEYDVSAFAPFYASATENNIGRVASHVLPVQQQGQKRKMIYEEFRENVKRRKRETKSGPCYMVAYAGSMEGSALVSPAVQAAFDLMDLSNGWKESASCG